MSVVRKFHGKCYYCICTVCTGYKCPWKHLTFKQCNYCQEHRYNYPRLDCDFFEHFMKKRRFRLRRVSAPDHVGTFVLYHSKGVMIGKYADLLIMQGKLGGYIRPYNIFDKRGYK